MLLTVCLQQQDEIAKPLTIANNEGRCKEEENCDAVSYYKSMLLLTLKS